ncbi:acyltransferase [Pikeienuella sp. HZG-20]|uniref:acyltransferase family protein n=1 Tax=Paludibacillus litoralis TaxID=3133267 RepID=UPI0030EE0742
MTGKTNGKILGLQALRGIAALMVLIGHSLAEAEHYFSTTFPLKDLPWTRGVDLFFVISGFIIVVASYDGRNSVPPLVFLKRRFLRVVPLYWFYTSLMVAALLVFPEGVKDTQLDIAQIVNSYVFIPYERYDGRVAPVLSLGWTLNYEIYFYVIFSALLAFGLRRAVLFLVLFFTAYSALGAVVDFDSTPLDFWSNALTLEFVFGALIGYTYLQRGRLAHRASFAVSAGGVVLGFGLLIWLDALAAEGRLLADAPRFLLAGGPAALIVGSAVLLLPERLDARTPKLLTALGDSSYSLYLSHRFVLRPMTMIWQRVLPVSPAYAPIYVICACVAALVAAYIAYLLIERRFLRLASRLRRRREAALKID